MNNYNVGKLIQEKRLAKKLTQEELANKLYVSNKTISKWENNRGMPSVDILLPLCETLSIELKELLTGKKDTKYEDLVIKELKFKKKRQKIELIMGIVFCLMLCLFEGVLSLTNLDYKYMYMFMGIFFFLFIVFGLCYDYINKK